MSLIRGTTGKGYGYKYGGQHIYKRIMTQAYSVLSFTQNGVDTLGPYYVYRSILGGGTGGRAGKGGCRTRGRSGDQGNGGIGGRGDQVSGQGSDVNDDFDGVHDFSTIIAQQLQNLLPNIVAQVGNQGSDQGNGRSQNGDAINDNIRGDNYAMVGAGHAAYTDRFHELARLVSHLVTPKSKRIERYVYGLALKIRGIVTATEP
ncbi:hypothetical protein Tco_0740474 [Tanacetum coccineum]